METPVISPRTLVYENPRQRVYRVEAKFRDFTKEFFVTNFGPRVGLVVIRDGHVLLCEQYRLLINAPSWEIPGGRVDDGETPETAATRECLEETGYRCLNPRPLVLLQPGLDTVENATHIYFSDEIAGAPEPDQIHANEIERCDWWPVDRCLDMISRREIVDNLTVSGLLAYQVFAAKHGPRR